MLKRPLVNMDMKIFAICTSTEPNTCFEASKNQIFSGRCGLSFHRLNTNTNNARPPKAAWTMSANEPSNLHSPSSCCCCGPVVGRSEETKVADEETAAATLVRVARSTEVGVGISTPIAIVAASRAGAAPRCSIDLGKCRYRRIYIFSLASLFSTVFLFSNFGQFFEVTCVDLPLSHSVRVCLSSVAASLSEQKSVD